ncbi:MAG: IPT/TIG domain-containing protein [Tannerella sp.]|jgi:hypothetical protein|nr:IPT/TIG domain-containing protein [Tannerella sp.]
MKTKEKNIKGLILCAIVALILTCCDDEKSSGIYGTPYDPSKPVELTSFHPDSGGVASQIILDGKNFGNDPSKIRLWFNKKQGRVVGSAGGRMYAIVPRMPGDTCTVSVVVGNDSVVYSKPFYYHISVSVSTLTGNGTEDPTKFGTLAESQFRGWFLAADLEGNVFATINDQGNRVGVVRINEEENTCAAIVQGDGWNVKGPAVDPATGVLLGADDNKREVYYYFNPAEAWMPRIKSFAWKEGTNIPKDPWHKAMPTCAVDGCVYVRYYNGNLVKLDPRTNVAETVFITDQGECFGAAFHPHQPNMLYLVFANDAGSYANGIYTYDVLTGEMTRLSGPTANGFRDGEVGIAQFNYPMQSQFDEDGNLYIVDRDNHCIRRLTTEGRVETVLGIPGSSGYKDGGKDDAKFNAPRGIAILPDGTIYICDTGNARIRKLAIE